MPDKIGQSGLHVIRVEGAPAFEEAKLVLVCRKLYAQEMKPECFIARKRSTGGIRRGTSTPCILPRSRKPISAGEEQAMWIADQWKDYEVLDTSGGEKLERWGKYLLIRPDPQVIWNSPKEHPGWKKRNGHYHRSSRGGGEWEFFHLPEQWQIHYRELTFNLKPFSFKHTGLFPEQAVNWDWFTEKIRRAGRPVKVLNLFAYTGGATLAAAYPPAPM